MTLATSKPFKIAVVVENPAYTPPLPPTGTPQTAFGIVAPLYFGLIGSATVRLENQVTDRDLIVSVPIKPGQTTSSGGRRSYTCRGPSRATIRRRPSSS